MITHLISTTEFVKLMESEYNFYDCTKPRYFLQLIVNYVDFISQKPELWMFVPCDEEGNVMEEPIDTTGGVELYDKKYKQAQSKVLFKGWKVNTINNDEIEIKNGKFHLLFEGNKINTTLEICIGQELTDYAIKQIGI